MINPVSQAGDYLLLQLAQVTLVVIVVGLVTRLACRNRPYVALALWMVVLIKCVVPPLVYSPWGVFCWFETIAHVPSPSPELRVTTIDAADSQLTDRDRTFSSGSRATAAALAGRSGKDPRSLDAVRAVGARFTDTAWTTIGVAVWLGGAMLLFLVYAVRCHLFLRRVSRDRRSAAGAAVLPTVERLVRRLSHRVGLRRPPRIVLSRSNLGPAVFGLWRPTVIFPAALVERLNTRELAPIVLHELMHLRRGDLWLALHSTAVRAIWWFHPLVWWSVRSAEWESERCCDESVVACLRRNPARYAHSLISALEICHQLKSSSLVPGVRPVDITAKRLERIMKLGQGSHRRMPVSCWALAILAAALVLPGAAGGLAQSPETREQVQEVRDARKADAANYVEISAEPEGHVQQASHETSLSVKTQARTQATGPVVTKIYAVADLLAKMKHEENWTEDPTDEQVKLALVNHLRCFSLDRQLTPLGLTPPKTQPLLDEQTRFAWSGDKLSGDKLSGDQLSGDQLSGDQLVVSGPEAAHQRLVKEIEFRRKHSFRQVTIEVRIMQGSPSLCAQITADDATAPDQGSAFWKNRWILFQQDFAAAEPTLIEQQVPPNGLQNGLQVDPVKGPLASITTGKSDPIVYQFLDDELFRTFLSFGEGDARNSIVMAPKVTLFDGQTAEISDCSQSPFVTDVTKVVGEYGVAYQPVIQVLWEGTKIQVAPTITPDGYRLKCRFRFASIDDCKTFRPSRYPDAKDVRVQHPVVSTASLECAIDIPTGQTLLIGGLFPRRAERNVEQSTLGRLLGRQPTKLVSEEVTYIAITPRTLVPEESDQ